MISFDFDKNCYGCKACEAVCPKKAISMKTNTEGFSMPFVDEALCVNCHLCETVCPHLSPVLTPIPFQERKFLSAFSKNDENRAVATSGGIFRPVAEWVLQQGGWVCGCIWNEKLEAEHILTNDLAVVKRMQGSKYVQSDTKDCFLKIKEKLQKDTLILFTGTPCQVGGLLSYVGQHKNLYTIALFCSGVPSPKIWLANKKFIEKKYNAKLVNVNMRCKGQTGWQSPTIRYDFENGKTVQYLSYGNDRYVKSFIQGLFLRNSCHHCQYKGTGHNADWIIGDYWGAPAPIMIESANRGVSAVILNTAKGFNLWNELASKFYSQSVSLDSILACNRRVMAPGPVHSNRRAFFENLDKLGFIECIKTFSRKDALISAIKDISYRTGFYLLAKKMLAFLRGSNWARLTRKSNNGK